MKIFDSHFHYYGETTPQEFYHTVLAELEVPPRATRAGWSVFS